MWKKVRHGQKTESFNSFLDKFYLHIFTATNWLEAENIAKLILVDKIALSVTDIYEITGEIVNGILEVFPIYYLEIPRFNSKHWI